MKILCVSQNKGGSGKTCTSRLVAEGLARAGKRVLIIDLDPQCNLSQRFITMERDPTTSDGFYPPLHPEYDPAAPKAPGDTWEGVSSSADIYLGDEVVPYPTMIENLDVLPGWGEKLRMVEMVTQDEVTEKVHNQMRKFLSDEEVQGRYDLVVIDTSPSKGPLVVSAMRSATHVVIPTVMEPQCVEGLQGMLMLWMQENRLRDVGDSIEMVGILPNMVKNVGLQMGILDSLQADPITGPMIMPHMLRNRVAFAEQDHQSVRPMSVFTISKKDAARIEAENVVAYIGERLGVMP